MKTSLIRNWSLWASLCCCAVTFPAFGVGFKTLAGHVPKISQRLSAVGVLPTTNELRLAIGVPLRDPAGLDQFLADVYNPASPNYRHFLTPAQFTARFSATEADYAMVKAFARSNHFQIVAEHGNRQVLDIRAKVQDVERALQVKLKKFKHPTEAREFFAPNADPVVDHSLPVTDIAGLSDYDHPRPRMHKPQSNAVMPQPHHGGSTPGGNFLGDDFRHAYVPGVNLTGAGQKVGLLEFDGFFPADIARYAREAGGGRTNITITTVLLGGYDGTPHTGMFMGNDDPEAEVALDIEMAMAMAPGLSEIIVFELNPTNNSPAIDILNAMAADSTVKNLSCSWSYFGPTNTMENVYHQLAAQGQALFVASGDNGPEWLDYDPEVWLSPYVTLVGGTTLTMNDKGDSYASEVVWNWGPRGYDKYDPEKFAEYVGSGGGGLWGCGMPDWQQGFATEANHGNITKRMIPDVALTADDCYIFAGNGNYGTVGGTSCAAPLWAGFAALVNEQAARCGQPPVGFWNPTLYQIAKTPLYNLCFHDITFAQTVWTNVDSYGHVAAVITNANFAATPGYDLCTGLGTPNGVNLINVFGGVWVDYNYSGSTENGSFYAPYKTLVQAASAVGSNSIVSFRSSGSKPETMTITKPMSILAPAGTVNIGH